MLIVVVTTSAYFSKIKDLKRRQLHHLHIYLHRWKYWALKVQKVSPILQSLGRFTMMAERKLPNIILEKHIQPSCVPFCFEVYWMELIFLSDQIRTRFLHETLGDVSPEPDSITYCSGHFRIALKTVTNPTCVPSKALRPSVELDPNLGTLLFHNNW